MEVRQRPHLALCLRLLGAAIFSLMFVLIKLVGARGVALPELMFWRQAVPAAMILGWLAARGRTGLLRTTRIRDHGRRALLGVVGMTFTLGVYFLLPMAEATTLGFTAPIFAVILAAVVLKEPVGWIRWTAVVLGLLGVAVIAGPDRDHLPIDGVAVAIVAAFMVALISIQVRDLGRTEHPVTTVFWFSALSMPLLAIPAALAHTPHDPAVWAMLGGIGLTGTIAQVAITAALRLGNVSSVIVMDYSGFGWATLWGWLVFANLPPATTWLGAPLIIAAGLVIVWREHALHREKVAGLVTT